MSIPAILGSIVLSFINGNFQLIPQLFADSVAPALAGAGAALVSGLLAVLLMLAILRRVRLTWFGLYTGVLGVLILLDQYLFHYIF
jgi:undecaprenyl pyrophosphate phosphatase UppP